MKNIFRRVFSLSLVASVFLLASCDKDETDDVSKITNFPVVNIEGDAVFTHQLGDPFVDPGYTAVDRITGQPVPVNVQTDLDVNSPGVYRINYGVVSPEGFAKNYSRQVNVLDKATILPDISGTYKTTNGRTATIERLSEGYYAMSDADGRQSIPVPVNLFNSENNTFLIEGNTPYGRIAGTGTYDVATDVLTLPLQYLDQGGFNPTRVWTKEP